jgi:P27 family predicted phage terminase small subunit
MGNHNSGRRPKPTALKVLRGNPGQRRLNAAEPRPPAGEIVRPETLSTGAVVVWDELAPICMAMKTLTPADVVPFATLCELQSTMRQTSAAKDGRRLFSLEAQDSEDRDSPMVIVIDATLKLERETATSLRPYYEYFGLTPSSRARISVPKQQDEPVSKWAGALK